ncbi:MAG: methyltransferase domain-containing protein [Candidatus Hydrogenedens sp.]|nr:methyltransferase domain-containing protein [Candidatus Hydrogenedens sp.]
MGNKVGNFLANLKRLRHVIRELNGIHRAQEKALASLDTIRSDQMALEHKFGQQLESVQQELAAVRKLVEESDLSHSVEMLDARFAAVAKTAQAEREALVAEVQTLKNRAGGLEDQIKKDRPVFNRLRDSWLHPDYYYKSIVGLMEDRQRLLYKAVSLLEPSSRVLDVGPGNCFAMEAFQANGHRPFGIGLQLESYIPREILQCYELIEGDYNQHSFEEPFDAIWASHVLEHQPNKLDFVRKLHRDLKEGGWLFVLVPPMKAEVVGGHLNLFNNGYLIYSLVVGGFDCSEAMVTKYGYNCVVFVRKKSFEMPELRYDSGDIETLSRYFPFEATQNFNGLHLELNWQW